ncbi:MAG: response regulator transcription factor [Burkholderiaceae bacterium]|nr:MAG: response regulator transcription factor [Burkholderiaceae bacterium]
MRAVQQPTSLPHILSGLLWLHYPKPDLLSLKHTLTVLRQQYPDTGIVVLSNAPADDEGLHALQNGAVGYCHAMATATLLAQVAAVVGHGGLWVGESLLRRLTLATAQMLQPAPVELAAAATLAQLSAREREVALAVARGASNREVAQHLDITERTVKAHLSAVFEKLGVRDRLQLVLLMKRAHIIDQPA